MSGDGPNLEHAGVPASWPALRVTLASGAADVTSDLHRAVEPPGATVIEPGLDGEPDRAREVAVDVDLPFVDLEATEVDPRAVRLLSPMTAEAFSALAIGFSDGTPIVAIADPSNKEALAHLRWLVGGAAYFVVASWSGIERARAAMRGGSEHEPSPADSPNSVPASGRPPVSGFSVSVRLADGEQLAVGEFADLGAADQCAAELARRLAAEEEIGWPRVGGRFVRPAAIVSVDVDPPSPGSPSPRS